MSLWNQDRYIGKRTAKGLVVKRLQSGRCVNTYFVPDNGSVKEMRDGGFHPVSAEVAETVGFTASREFQA